MGKDKRRNFELLLNRFREQMKLKGFTQRTIEAYTQEIHLFYRYLEEKTNISDIKEIDREAVNDYQAHLFYLEDDKGKRLSSSTQARKLGILRGFFSFLVREDYLVYNPAQDLSLPRIKRRIPKDILSRKEINRLLKIPDLNRPLGFRDRAILELLYSSGMRVSELSNLKIYDLDLDNSTLRIEKGKGEKSRIIPILFGTILAIIVFRY
jgi:integrase/recombinase XerD